VGPGLDDVCDYAEVIQLNVEELEGERPQMLSGYLARMPLTDIALSADRCIDDTKLAVGKKFLKRILKGIAVQTRSFGASR